MESPLTDISVEPVPNETVNKTSKNWLASLGKWFLIMVGVIFIASFAVAYHFEDELKGKLVKAINGQLKTELEIEDFTLSLFKGFPNVSADFSNVVLEGTFENGQAPLVEASSLSFTVPLMQLISDNINIQSVLLKDGAVSIYVNSKGVSNYEIIKSSGDTENTKDFQLNIAEAVLENVEIIYTNKGSDITSKVRIDKATLSGNFSADRYALESVGKAESHFIDISDKRFIPGNQFDFDFILDIDMNESRYVFEEGNLSVDGNKFDIKGDIINDPDGFIYDLKIKSQKGNLATVFTLLPEQYLDLFKDFESDGTFLFDLTYKGQKTLKENPKLNANMRLKDGEIQSPQLNKPIKDVSFTANFNNGKYKNLKSSRIKVSDFKGYFNRQLTKMDLEIYNLDDPNIDLELDGTIPVNSIYKFFKHDMLSDATGELAIKNLNVQGKTNDMRSMSRISKVKVSGEIEFEGAGLSLNDYPFVADRGALLLKGNNIEVKNLQIKGADSDAKLSGTFKNFIPVIFADSTNSQNAELKFKSELLSNNLDLDELIAAFKSKESISDEDEEDTGWHSKISGFLDGSFDAYVKNLNYDKLKGEEFEGSLDFDNDVLTISGDVEAMEGSMSLEGELYLQKTPKLIGEIEAKNIDVYKFFKQSQNFGQNTIIHENLKGQMNANMIINAFFDERGTFLTDKLHVYAGLEIHDGELVGLDLLNNFDNFVKSEDLRRIKFTRLENWFEIQSGKIHIPVMFIQSNALNMEVSGTHTFDHDINYNVKINPIQVLTSRFKKHNKNRNPQKDQRGGLVHLHYTIRGTVDDYVVKKNKAAVQANFKSSKFKKDKIRRELKNSFGAFDLNSSVAETPKTEPKPEPKPVPVTNDPPTPKKEEVIHAQIDDNAIPDFEVEDEEDTEYIEFQGDDGN